MTIYTFGVEAEYVRGNIYEVFCNVCKNSIGTMVFAQIRSAYFNTFSRGGVRCPTCRERTCDHCGEYYKDGGLHRYAAGRDSPLLCVRCTVAHEAINEEFVEIMLADLTQEEKNKIQPPSQLLLVYLVHISTGELETKVGANGKVTHVSRGDKRNLPGY